VAVILSVNAIKFLTKMSDEIVGQRIIVRQTEEKVSPAVIRRSRCGLTRSARAGNNSAGRAKAITTGIAERAVEGIVVVDGHPDMFVLIAEL
jgi:hypothetical protein